MKRQLISKVIVLLFLIQFLCSCKNNISGGVGSDGKPLDSIVTNLDNDTITKKNSKSVKE
ncbi:hypothetical protein HYN86_14080 [Flavobacterium fluviale]|uniref:Uncharacterized protein n=1 Tax=Flavobacterium fluviale TaxID=2249356 RepID=A0A344LUR9_9FLAO|nr:hypothetical protein HYN86_14080 [Flavobacterium fluviale]